MKILITGGSGYIGSVLTSMLLEECYQVKVLDNLYNQKLPFGQPNANSNLIRGDVRNEEEVKKAMADVDFIFPLAAIVGAPACDRTPELAKATNLDAILTLLKFRAEGQKIIFPATNSGYGIGQEGIYCTEETPLNPVSLYGKLKVEAEKQILNDGNSIGLRLATVFGISPQMRIDLLVNDFVHRAVTDRVVVLFQGHFKRNYIHIRDVAKAFIHCLRNFDRMKNQVYNVGLSSANLSKLELCQEIQKQIPSFNFTEDGVGEDLDQRNYIVSNAKIEATGFKPSVSLQDGIAELIKGYKNESSQKQTKRRGRDAMGVKDG